ncbi:uncharacterized protein RSE6_08232 [Rhynchosporium secalis]|uniref:Uncharacterized protein n=1 Tax=Rhynchosporium secalis TaxID=38038 RepID=A0A1E1MF40_RHYSE|nr:uncharacterized protein RSE6_08232 [Rhynchosporium secalis]
MVRDEDECVTLQSIDQVVDTHSVVLGYSIGRERSLANTPCESDEFPALKSFQSFSEIGEFALKTIKTVQGELKRGETGLGRSMPVLSMWKRQKLSTQQAQSLVSSISTLESNSETL